MDRRRKWAALTFVAIMLAMSVFLTEVSSAYQKSAIGSAVVGVFCIGAVIGSSGDRPATASVIVGIVAVGFLGAVYWESLDRYRLPPTSPETYVIVPLVVVIIGLFGYGVGVLVRYRDPPLRPSAPGTVRLLAATGIGLCLFVSLSLRVAGSVGFFLTVLGGILLIVLLDGHNGYEGGIAVTSVLIATVLMTSVVAGVAFAEFHAPISSGGGIDETPSTGVGSLVFVVPAIGLGLVAHRIGQSVEHRRSPTD